ncbi:hypothetical protein HELRODRAFT_166854 [Helobdella robusta]|uniref:Peptidase A2 domain-containing protein n=1 Tax=Helobdella robusta TaxID=6412 RepID=T1EYM8_HELRO|nr:hypothetical protein HELRODRAFT_166854 [Helobdella robusta]ESO11806.1 hypothetical protein HELRODRAFT_166854 [Helobdella robusta]
MTQRFRQDLRACGKVGPYPWQEGPVYSDPEESDRPREESEGGRRYRAAGGVYDRHGADDRHRPYRVDDRRRSQDSGDDERVDGRNGRRERGGNLHDHDDENFTIGAQREASQCLWDLTGLGYHELKSKLEDRFGTRGHESYKHELHILRRKPGESLGKLAIGTRDQALDVIGIPKGTVLYLGHGTKISNQRVEDVGAADDRTSSDVRRVLSWPSMLHTSEERRRSQTSINKLTTKQAQKFATVWKAGSLFEGVPHGKGVKEDVGRSNQSTCSNDQAIYLPINVDGKRKLGLLDSGSSVSILPTSMFGQTKITIEKNSAAVALVTKDVGANRMCRIELNEEVEIPARTDFDVPSKIVVRQPSKFELSNLYPADEEAIDDEYENTNLMEVLIKPLIKSIPEEATIELVKMLKIFSEVFSCSKQEIGMAKGIYHEIETLGARPVKQQLRRYLPTHQQVVAKQVDEMIEQDVIEPAHGPWFFNIQFNWTWAQLWFEDKEKRMHDVHVVLLNDMNIHHETHFYSMLELWYTFRWWTKTDA